MRNTSITSDSLIHIIENLQQTLEKLDVYLCDDLTGDLTYAKLTMLKSMPKLKDLNYLGSAGEIQDLKNVMPFVRIGEIITADERELSPADGIWDVEAKQLEFYKKDEKKSISRFAKGLAIAYISRLKQEYVCFKL